MWKLLFISYNIVGCVPKRYNFPQWYLKHQTFNYHFQTSVYINYGYLINSSLICIFVSMSTLNWFHEIVHDNYYIQLFNTVIFLRTEKIKILLRFKKPEPFEIEYWVYFLGSENVLWWSEWKIYDVHQTKSVSCIRGIPKEGQIISTTIQTYVEINLHKWAIISNICCDVLQYRLLYCQTSETYETHLLQVSRGP